MDELFEESVKLQNELLGQIEPYGVGLGDYEFVGREWFTHSMLQLTNPDEPTEYLKYKTNLNNRLQGLPDEIVKSWCLAAVNIEFCIRIYKTEPAHALSCLLKASREIGMTYGMANGVFWEASSSARRAVLKKISTDPKQKDKALVREFWYAWQKQPFNPDGTKKYKGKSAFAKDMLDKFPNLESHRVITDKWCPMWAKENLTLPAK